MTWKSLVGEIQRSIEGVKYATVACTVRFWGRGNDGSLWVLPNANINNITGSGNTSTTIQTTVRKVVPRIMSQSGLLVGVDYG